MALILCIDDDESVARLVSDIVRFCQHEPVVETRSMEVLANWIQDKRIGAVLADYMMPKIDGIELLSVFQEQRPDVRRMLITAAPTEEAVLKAAKDGTVQMVIAKPPAIADIKLALAWLPLTTK